MNPMDLKVEDVRKELETLITQNPDRYGMTNGESPNDDFNDSACVYFLDEDDSPIQSNVDVRLVTPICIVGTWIERFHPEFKSVQEIRDELITNVGVSSWNDRYDVLPSDVVELLLTAQMQQDQGRKWGDIQLDKPSDRSLYGI